MVVMGEKSKRYGQLIEEAKRRAEFVRGLPFYSQPKAIKELAEATEQLLHSMHAAMIFMERDLEIKQAASTGQVRIEGREGFTWRVQL